MQFEYDPKKSKANQLKHSVNFEYAQEIWGDSARVEIPARTTDEPRVLVLGRIRGKTWAAVVTLRGDAVRLISVRRARKEEEAIYESEGI